MKVKKEITSRADIELLVDTFYNKITADSKIGFIFQKHMLLTFEEHMPIMYNFWESILLHTNTYKGNPILKHIELNKKVTLTKDHFDHWVLIWNSTVDELFIGTKADEAKQKAESMKQLMLYKLNQSNSSNFIQ